MPSLLSEVFRVERSNASIDPEQNFPYPNYSVFDSPGDFSAKILRESPRSRFPSDPAISISRRRDAVFYPIGLAATASLLFPRGTFSRESATAAHSRV